MGFLLDIESGGELDTSITDRTVVRIATVDDLAGSDLDAMLWDAEQVLANLGTTDPPLLDIVIGAAHPTIPGIVVVRLHTTPVKACSKALVEIHYGIPRFDVPLNPADDGVDHKTVRYMGQPRPTTFDPKDGTTELVVSPPPIYAGRGDQVKTITVNEAVAIITFQRTEPNAPTLRQRTHQNTLNEFALGTGIYAIKTLYCNLIQADTADQGGIYVVRYEFLYREDGHDIEFKWERPPLDVPAYDVDSRKMLEPYKTSDFGLLGLNFND